MGLVSSVCFAELGHSVNLIEVDRYKVKAIRECKPPIYEEGLNSLLQTHIGKKMHVCENYNSISDTDITILCVGTPQGTDGNADLSMIASASRSLGSYLIDNNSYHLVVVKSTVPPGTTESLIIPSVLKYSGRTLENIGFATNPEFLREGLAIQDFMNPDRIVIGSMDKSSGDLAQSLYSRLNAPVIRTGIASAEMIKYASNAFLAMKISYANEIGNICKALGIDVYEVMKGVGMDHRISPHFLNAGAGFGGSCFPKDVSALIRLSESLEENPAILKAVMEVNNRQPLRMVELLEHRIGDLRGRRVAVLGLAFKDGTDDVRDSRSIPVIEALRRRGAQVVAYDPMAEANMSRIFPDIEYFNSAVDALCGADACLLMTEWPEFRKLEKEFKLMNSRVIIEGRRLLSCRDREGICW